MDPSSPTNELPPGVEESELVDGPPVAPFSNGKAAFLAPDELLKPVPRPPEQPPPRPQPPPPPLAAMVSSREVVRREYPDVLAMALDVLAIRLHVLVALVASCGVWVYTSMDPQPWRILAAASFSALTLLPLMLLWWRVERQG